jgi:repressor LexA
MNKATLRSREQVLKFVYGFGKKLNTPPVMIDDRSRRGVIPPSVVEYNLNRLVIYGLLVREPDGWVVPEAASQRQMSPRIDTATSLPTGTPMPVWGLAASSQEFDTVEVSAELVEKFGNLFALRVIGTGMIDALIDDGDVVVIKSARCAKDGEMVVAWFIKEETTILRKFYSEGDYVRLQPANSTMGPIYALKGNIEVRSKVVSVIRALS